MTDRRSRFAPAALFAVFGVMYGAWQVLLTDLSRALDLSPGALGLALSAGFLASLPTMIIAGRVSDRWGQRRTIVTAGLTMAAICIAFAAIDSVVLLVALLLLFASSSGIYDVGINAAAMSIERRTQRRVMSFLHAVFSGGGAAGALATGGLLALGLPFRAIYLLVAGVLIVTIGWAVTSLPEGSIARAQQPAARRGAGLFRHPALLTLAAITALAFLFEGVMETWSVIYLRQSLDLPAIVGASGGAIFHLAMMTGRLAATAMIVRFGRRATLRGGGILAVVGIAAALSTTLPAVILLGFLIVGLSLAAIAPITFSLAGDIAPDQAGEASAVITTLGYGGFLLGPSLIGGLAELVGLRLALSTGALVGLAIVLLAGRVSSTPAASPTDVTAHAQTSGHPG